LVSSIRNDKAGRGSEVKRANSKRLDVALTQVLGCRANLHQNQKGGSVERQRKNKQKEPRGVGLKGQQQATHITFRGKPPTMPKSVGKKKQRSWVITNQQQRGG